MLLDVSVCIIYIYNTLETDGLTLFLVKHVLVIIYMFGVWTIWNVNANLGTCLTVGF